MYNLIIRPFWLVGQGAFSSDKRIRNYSALAFAILIASIGGCIYTAFISMQSYSDTLGVGEGSIMAWGISIGIAFLMFAGVNLPGLHAAETIHKVQHTFDVAIVGIVAFIITCVGVFDALKNLEGATIRSETWFKTSTFEDSRIGKELPYQKQIDANNVKIQSYQDDKIGGEMRWGNQDKIERIEKQSDSLLNLQRVELKELREAHQNQNSQILYRKKKAGRGLRILSGFIYIILLLLAVPLNYFLVMVDLADGKYDGAYDSDDSKISKPVVVKGFETSANSGNDLEKLYAKIERLERDLRNSNSKNEEVGNNTSVSRSRNVYGQNVPTLPTKKNANLQQGNRFTQANQPGNRQGISSIRVDFAESRSRILAAYKAFKKSGVRPTNRAIAKEVNLSERTVGTHMRQLKSDGVIS